GLSLIAGLLLTYFYGTESLATWGEMGSMKILIHKSLVLVFWISWLVMSVLSYKYNFSLLPVIGVLINLYLMSELGASNWLIFIIWLLIGLIIYFSYGYKNSKLRNIEN